MTEDWTEDGYPTEAALERITKWPIKTVADVVACLDFVKACWHWPDWGWAEYHGVDDDGKKTPLRVYAVSTGGWSGNESLIHAMAENFVLWALCWHSHRRGGHYELRVRMEAKIGL